MNIQEATKKSLETGSMIKRKGWESEQTSIIPTNTPDGCICFCNLKSPRKGWQPLAEDLISDDWVVI